MQRQGVYIHGLNGKMGRALLALIAEESCFVLKQSLLEADVGIDFTVPEALELFLKQCVTEGKPAVIGTTGHPNISALLQKAAETIPLFFSPNLSLGMIACMEMVRYLHRQFRDEFGVRIIEMHHVDKRDSPSGTAVALLEILENSTIPIESVRHAEAVGNHTITFTFQHEEIQIIHRAQSRRAFAKGALLASKFLIGKKPGVYSGRDLLCYEKGSNR